MKGIFCLVLYFIVSAFSIPAPKPKKPNIIILFSDDHALQAISAYGSPYIKTPNIDRLAASGALFKNAFCTNSICAPSRAVLLTGKYNHLNGQIDNRLDTRIDTWQPSFAKYLQAGGYTTSWIGKWHINNTPRYFDYWKVLPGQGKYYNPDFMNMDSTLSQVQGYATEIITDQALAWLDKTRQGDKPFCLVIGHKAPHREWMPDLQDLEAFNGKPFKIPDNYFDPYTGRKAAAHQQMEIKNQRWDWDLKVNGDKTEIVERMSPEQQTKWKAYYDRENAGLDTNKMTAKEKAIWKYQRYMHDYLGCILSLDRNIGRVMDYVEKSGLKENTVIIYSSDQGFYLGEHGWYDKRFMYEPSLHMPLIVNYPGHSKPGSQIDKMVVNIDFAPTILNMAGLLIPKDMQGVSFLPLLENNQLKNWRKSMYYHYYEYPDHHSVLPHFGIRTERYKLIRFEDKQPFWEYYDLQKDPEEMNNLYEQAGQKPAIDKMKKELKQLILKYKDTEALKQLTE